MAIQLDQKHEIERNGSKQWIELQHHAHMVMYENPEAFLNLLGRAVS